jgi:hypothetical protein
LRESSSDHSKKLSSVAVSVGNVPSLVEPVQRLSMRSTRQLMQVSKHRKLTWIGKFP